MHGEKWLRSQCAPGGSVHERVYLHRRLLALESLAARLEQRAAAAAPADAAFFLRRAAKSRSRAERLRAYVRSTRPDVGAVDRPRVARGG
jgi:hypothetical protein